MRYNFIYKLSSDPLHILHGSVQAPSVEMAIIYFKKHLEPIDLIAISQDNLVDAKVDQARWNRSE